AGAENRKAAAGVSKSRGLLGDAEYDDIVRVLIGREQKRTGRADREVTRRLPLCRHEALGCERALALVAGVDRDAVVPAIGCGEEFAVWMHGNLGGTLRT